MQQPRKFHLLVAIAVSSMLPSQADLGAAVRRSSLGKNVILPAAAPLEGPLKIHLDRVRARGSSTGTFYVGKLGVGEPPQELSVLFDTGSGHVLLPHRACKSAACLEHRRFSTWESQTAMDVNVNGSLVQMGRRIAQGNAIRSGVGVVFAQADLGEGKAQAVVVRDNVCMQGRTGLACVDMGMVAAISMEDMPFRAMPNDGIVGLGLESLTADPLMSFVGRLIEGSKNVLPQFGISFGAESGDIYFGGHDPSLAMPIQWFPVDHPNAGYWQVAIQAVRAGDVVVDSCQRGCHGVVDSGASRLGVQASNLPKIRAALVSTPTTDGGCRGPTLEFDLGGFMITLEPQDYTDASCTPELGPLNLEEPEFVGVYTLGETVLRRYYTAFDWANRRVGFAASASKSDVVLV